MQLVSHHTEESISHSFSTLYGSKWVATSLIACCLNFVFEFQYPLRVEVGCNSWHTQCLDWEIQCFSTLYGSKWVATQDRQQRAAKFAQFQYPLRVEVGCNCLGMRAVLARCTVSVPSTGRSGLQRSACVFCLVVVCCFSTLYGSKWVATQRKAR